MSKELRDIALLFLAAVSTIVSYAGLNTSIPQESLWWKLLCASVAVAVGVAIYVFWKAAFDASVKPPQFKNRTAGWLATLVGSFFLLGMSSWWNVAAIGGHEALRAGMFGALRDVEHSFVENIAGASSYRPFVARITTLGADLQQLADCERQSGCVSGSGGNGGVSATLAQLAVSARELASSLTQSDTDLTARAEAGRMCLAEMRKALDANAGATEVSGPLDCINSAMTAIAANGQLDRIAQEMGTFTAGVVIPATVRTEAQKASVANILASIQTRASAISADAAAAISRDLPEAVSLPQMSAMKAVIVYYDSILPSWITGIALDLLPLVLMSFSSTIAASKREQPDMPGDISLIQALRTAWALKDLDAAREIKPTGQVPAAVAPSVTQITYRPENPEPESWDEWIEVGELYDEDDLDGRS